MGRGGNSLIQLDTAFHMALVAGAPFVSTLTDNFAAGLRNGHGQTLFDARVWNISRLKGRIAVALPTPPALPAASLPRGRPGAHDEACACPSGRAFVVDKDMVPRAKKAAPSGAKYDCTFSYFQRCQSTVVERRAIYQQQIRPLLLPSVWSACEPEAGEDSVVVHIRDGDVAEATTGDHAQPPCAYYHHVISTGFGGRPFRRVRLVHSGAVPHNPCMQGIVAQHGNRLVVDPDPTPSLAKDTCLLLTARNLALATSSFSTTAMMMNRDIRQLFVMDTTIAHAAMSRFALNRTELCAALPRVVHYRLTAKRYKLLDEKVPYTVSTCGDLGLNVKAPRIVPASKEARKKEKPGKLRTCGDPARRPNPFSGVVVTSAGGRGTTATLMLLSQAGIKTNRRNDQDHLKHMLPGCRGFHNISAAVGGSPLIIFLYGDPADSHVALAAKGWVNIQAKRLSGKHCVAVNASNTKFQKARASCIKTEAVLHAKKPYGHSKLGCPTGEVDAQTSHPESQTHT